MNETPSSQVVDQRIRNRIIEVLELFSDPDAFEIAINNLEFWADSVDEQAIAMFGLPVFSDIEREEVKKVKQAWESVWPDSSQSSIEWIKLSQSAERAVGIFLLRGRLSEDVEDA